MQFESFFTEATRTEVVLNKLSSFSFNVCNFARVSWPAVSRSSLKVVIWLSVIFVTFLSHSDLSIFIFNSDITLSNFLLILSGKLFRKFSISFSRVLSIENILSSRRFSRR
ncbi:hypothetical protein EGW08_006366, partial [Elysia chlorotica]